MSITLLLIVWIWILFLFIFRLWKFLTKILLILMPNSNRIIIIHVVVFWLSKRKQKSIEKFSLNALTSMHDRDKKNKPCHRKNALLPLKKVVITCHFYFILFFPQGLLLIKTIAELFITQVLRTYPCASQK